MVPLKGVFSRMARAVRDLSRQSGKPVELLTTGDETEIDRNIVEALADSSDAGTTVELVELADRCLYNAKNAGRNIVRCHASPVHL